MKLAYSNKNYFKNVFIFYKKEYKFFVYRLCIQTLCILCIIISLYTDNSFNLMTTDIK